VKLLSGVRTEAYFLRTLISRPESPFLGELPLGDWTKQEEIASAVQLECIENPSAEFVSLPMLWYGIRFIDG